MHVPTKDRPLDEIHWTLFINLRHLHRMLLNASKILIDSANNLSDTKLLLHGQPFTSNVDAGIRQMVDTSHELATLRMNLNAISNLYPEKANLYDCPIGFRMKDEHLDALRKQSDAMMAFQKKGLRHIGRNENVNGVMINDFEDGPQSAQSLVSNIMGCLSLLHEPIEELQRCKPTTTTEGGFDDYLACIADFINQQNERGFPDLEKPNSSDVYEVYINSLFGRIKHLMASLESRLTRSELRSRVDATVITTVLDDQYIDNMLLVGKRLNNMVGMFGDNARLYLNTFDGVNRTLPLAEMVAVYHYFTRLVVEQSKTKEAK